MRPTLTVCSIASVSKLAGAVKASYGIDTVGITTVAVVCTYCTLINICEVILYYR